MRSSIEDKTVAGAVMVANVDNFYICYSVIYPVERQFEI